MDVFEHLRDYFEGIAQSLDAQKLASSAFSNKSDKGHSREKAFLDFLSGNLPGRCEAVRGGFIFDSAGKCSNQIDLLVINDLTLRFRSLEERSFNCIEGCYCAVSVKSMLDKKECIDSLENLASIPSMPDMTKSVLPILKNAAELVQDLPLKVVFAFDGAGHETIIGHINDYYAANTVPEDKKPDLIVVNRRYVIHHVGKQGGRTRGGTEFKPDSFHGAALKTQYAGAYSLMYLLTRIQRASVLGSQVIFDFGGYLDRVDFS